MAGYLHDRKQIIAEFCNFEQEYPSFRNDVIEVLVSLGGQRHALCLDELKYGFAEKFGRLFPLDKDPIYIKYCLMLIPGMATTTDGLWYCYMYDKPQYILVEPEENFESFKIPEKPENNENPKNIENGENAENVENVENPENPEATEYLGGFYTFYNFENMENLEDLEYVENAQFLSI